MMGLRISSSMSQCFAELETKTLHGLYLESEQQSRMVCYMQHQGLSLLFGFAFSGNHLYNWYKLVDGRLCVCLFCFLYVDPVSEWVQERTELKHLS